MPARRQIFEQFVRRVRRRFLVLRLLERAGIGILLACAAAVPLLLIALWRDQPALPIAAVALIVGATAGVLWGILTRPTPIETALEVDRQLGWADLLGSALAVGEGTGDPWAQAVTASADARCRGISPSSVILNRLGARAWGGIGLAASLVVTLGLLPTYPTLSEAREERPPAPLHSLLASRANEHSSFKAAPGGRRAARAEEPQDANATREGSGSDVAPDQKTGSPGAELTRPPRADGNLEEQGSGSSRTDVKDSGAVPRAQQATGAASNSHGTNAAAGSGKSASSQQGSDEAVSGVGSTEQSAPSAPPWQSSDWPRQVQRAHEAMESGRVPDSYRDVVRGYFDRQ